MKPLLGLVFLSFMSTAIAADTTASFKDRLGIQLWSLRAQFKTEGASALDRVKNEYGLREVEAYGGTGLSVADLTAAAKSRGLEIVSCHVSYDALKQDTAAVIRDVKAMGAKYAFIAYMGKFKGAKIEDIHALAAEFNAFGEAFKKEGIRFGLHNHGIEFSRVGDKGEFAFDVFARETKPELVCLEMDVFWVVNAGQDPVTLLKKYPNRWVALHVKDLRKGAVSGTGTGSAPATDNVPVGQGQMDWPAILTAAQADGVRFYFLEDETPAPLECIPASLSYLRGLKL
jgi:sugar phosphate isomerase/epimerase